MKRQEILDAVTAHAKKMNTQCLKDGACVYRGTNGKMCLIGALIKDEHYTKDLDINSRTANEPEVILALKKSGVLAKGTTPKSTKVFLENLQSAHDNVTSSLKNKAFRDNLKENLESVAIQYGLKLNW